MVAAVGVEGEEVEDVSSGAVVVVAAVGVEEGEEVDGVLASFRGISWQREKKQVGESEETCRRRRSNSFSTSDNNANTHSSALLFPVHG